MGAGAPVTTKVPFSKPSFDEAEARAVVEVIATGWVSQGPQVAEFERRFAARQGAAHGVATTSCTTALHLALLLEGIGPGDEVICPSYTMIASANAIVYAGATPIFAEIDAATGNLDPGDVRARLTPRTKAIMLVHQAGLAADLDAFVELRPSGVRIIEDAACVAGAVYKDRPIGSHGNIACFSFHPRKTLSTGEGGILLTDDREVAERARELRSFGANVSDHVRHLAGGTMFEQYTVLGYNYRMTDLQAAVGLEQLRKLDGFIAERRSQAARYDAAFAGKRGLLVPISPSFTRHTYQSYWLRFTADAGVDRDALLASLASRGISCRRGIPPIHLEPLYRASHPGVSLPITDEVARSTIFLPIFNGLTVAQQDYVVESILELTLARA